MLIYNVTTRRSLNIPQGVGITPPTDHFWTYRFNSESGVYEYNLYDQIWISNSLSKKLTHAFVLRRSNVGDIGSDHDPVWVEFETFGKDAYLKIV